MQPTMRLYDPHNVKAWEVWSANSALALLALALTTCSQHEKIGNRCTAMPCKQPKARGQI